MTKPQHDSSTRGLPENQDKVSRSEFQKADGEGESSSTPSAEAPLKQAARREQNDDEGEPNDDNAELASTSSSGGQRSSEGYTADCSSDASSDLSGSAKKKEKDNMILSVNNLSIDDDENDENDTSAPPIQKEGETGADETIQTDSEPQKDAKKHKKKRKEKQKTIIPSVRRSGDNNASNDGDSDMADVEDEGNLPVQFNGVQVVHPMDPRIDISKVGYLYGSPVGHRHGGDQPHNSDQPQPPSNNATRQDEVPSLENYLQLMEVVRPFFNSHGIGAKESPKTGHLPTGVPTARPSISSSRRVRAAYGLSAGDSRTSTSLTGTRSSSSQSSNSVRHTGRRDAPLHMSQRTAANAAKAQLPLQLAARQKPLAAAAAADFYAPDDDLADEDDSDTSSMVVLARTKRKHKQNTNSASESASQATDRSLRRNDEGARNRRNDDDIAAMENAEHDDDDRKPAARPQAPPQQEVGNQRQEHPPAEDEAAQASSSSSGGDQRPVVNQGQHHYDVAHVVTESASNTNTTTSGSGSGSGGNSGSNQGSSGSGNGSSGSGNGSSGSGNEEKGSSEDVGAKEENNGEGNSNSEDINSDDRKPDSENEITHSLVARRHGINAAADGGANDPMNVDMPIPHQAPTDQQDAERERKLQDKKRKRMNMRREYEEKVQQEMESSESSSAHAAITLRPGRPVTLDKVLSFTKIARMVIQAGPPFLVVHTNAAYTRLTGIDAHAAVGKPVSALLSVQGPDRLSSNMNPEEGRLADGAARAPVNPASNGAGGTRQLMEAPRQNRMGAFEVETITSANANNGQRLGQSYAQAEEAGRARAAEASQNDTANINLERLVAACGFGKYHVLFARTRPHQMVGRNVTFVNKSGATGLPPSGSGLNSVRKQDDGSSDTSLTTNNFEGPFESLKCRSSISPIISDTIDSAVVTDNNQEPHHKSKRRKHHHHGTTDQQGSQASWSAGHHHRRAFFAGKDPTITKRYLQYVTHYVIQLELFDDSKELNDRGSSSSTSIEANLLGLTKAELRRQRETAQAGEHGTSQEDSEQNRQQDEDDEMASETTEATPPVTAVG